MSPGTAIPTVALVAARPFGPSLGAERVAAAIARGLLAGGRPQPDLCPIGAEDAGDDVRSLLDALDFDTRMRGSRAVVVAEHRLAESTLEGSPAFEIATRARQAGVPAYAITAENALDAFDARMLDLQAIVVAASARALVAAGRKLAALI